MIKVHLMLHCGRYRKIGTAFHRLQSVLYSSQVQDVPEKEKVVTSSKYEEIPISNIRNFSIIAHIDHGKSTLADRLLEITGTMRIEAGTAQVLDRLEVEKERGITVKAVTASLKYVSKIDHEEYLLNLVDTPGHVDFSNEVSRSLAACQSVILLVDAKEGVQAQTYANFYLAFFKELVVIPVLNKIDLKDANPEHVEGQMKNLFDIEKKDILRISAKYGTGVEDLLETIIARSPPPPANRELPFRSLLFDSWWHNKYKGTLIQLYVQDGVVREGDTIVSNHTGNNYIVKEVGIVNPNEHQTGILKGGQIGYVACSMLSPSEAHIGDTFYMIDHPVEPFPGFEPARPMVYAGIYPVDQGQHIALKTAVEKLILTDSAVSVEDEFSPALGHGYRLGFLGLLHLEVFNQRLDQEYDAQTVMTSPSVTYKVKLRDNAVKRYKKDEIFITNPLDLPEPIYIRQIYEPIVLGTIITPVEYMGDILNLCNECRGVQKNCTAVDDTRLMIQYILPLNEIMVDFHDRLKTATSGFGTFDYEDQGFVPSKLIKMDILLNGKRVDELCTIVHDSKLKQVARYVCIKLKDIIPRQQFDIKVQAAVNSKIIAREDIKAYRKNVTQDLYGGDFTRRLKLLRRQEEGKKRMRLIGNIEIPRDTYIQLLKK